MSFTPNRNSNGEGPVGSSISVASLNDLGFLAHFANQVRALTGMLGAGLIRSTMHTVQLAQRDMPLLVKISDSIKSLSCVRLRLTQTNRLITFESSLGPDIFLISAAMIDEQVNQPLKIHLDLLSRKIGIGPEKSPASESG